MTKTIFLDIDGCILSHYGDLSTQMLSGPKLLPGTIQKINEWNRDGHMIILTTGRKECMRKKTIKQLTKLGVFFDQLIMGINRGERVIINDIKPENTESVARAIQIPRNMGISSIQL